MKLRKSIIYFVVILIMVACRTNGPQKGEKWIAMHFLNYNSDADIEKLGQLMPDISNKGINVCVLDRKSVV